MERRSWTIMKGRLRVFARGNEISGKRWVCGYMIDWRFTARQRKIGQFVLIVPGGLLAQAFEDCQRGAYKNIQLHAIQLTYTYNDKQQVCLTRVKLNNANNKLHDPEWVKNATPSLLIVDI